MSVRVNRAVSCPFVRACTNNRQELMKGSFCRTCLALETTLSRVDLFIECLAWEIQHAHCCESQSKQSYLSVKGNMILFVAKNLFLKINLVGKGLT